MKTVLPDGKVLKKEIDLTRASFPSLLKELKEKKFSGYVAITIRGGNGLEDGFVAFDSGKVMAAVYEYGHEGKTIKGKPAFERAVNATAAPAAYADVIELRPEEVQNFLSIESNAAYAPSEEELANAKAEKFSLKFEEEVAGLPAESTQQSLLNKYKLADVLAGFKKKEDTEKRVEPKIEEEEGRIRPPSFTGTNK